MALACARYRETGCPPVPACRPRWQQPCHLTRPRPSTAVIVNEHGYLELDESPSVRNERPWESTARPILSRFTRARGGFGRRSVVRCDSRRRSGGCGRRSGGCGAGAPVDARSGGAPVDAAGARGGCGRRSGGCARRRSGGCGPALRWMRPALRWMRPALRWMRPALRWMRPALAVDAAGTRRRRANRRRAVIRAVSAKASRARAQRRVSIPTGLALDRTRRAHPSGAVSLPQDVASGRRVGPHPLTAGFGRSGLPGAAPHCRGTSTPATVLRTGASSSRRACHERRACHDLKGDQKERAQRCRPVRKRTKSRVAPQDAICALSRGVSANGPPARPLGGSGYQIV